MSKRMPLTHRKDEVAVLPPDFRSFGSIPFDAKERMDLGAWLGEAGWPREAMNFETLEGYLVALLVWPVDLPSGAWLPLVWGERGWKRPAKLSAPKDLDRFVTLIGGFLQHLDSRLTAETGRFVPVLGPTETRQEWRPKAPCRWALGFMSALQRHAYGLKYRSTAARHAAESIAHWAFWASEPKTATEVSHAVHALVSERSSRGPLGPLVAHEFAEPMKRASGKVRASAARRTSEWS